MPPARPIVSFLARLAHTALPALLAGACWSASAAAQDWSTDYPGPDSAIAGTLPLAQRVHLRLDYKGAPGCADAQLFRDVLAARARHWDVWAPVDPWPLEIRITRRGQGYEGRGELRDAAGGVRWKLAYSGAVRCIEILSDLARSLVLKIDPPGRLLPIPVCKPAPEPARAAASPEAVPVCAPAPPAPVPSEPTKRVTLRFSGAAWADVVAASKASVGLAVGAGVRYGWASAELEGRWDPPLGATNVGDREVSLTRATAGVLLCGHYKLFVGCTVGKVGAVVFSMPGGIPDHLTLPFGAMGVQVGAELPLAPHVSLRVAADLLGTIRRPSNPINFGQGQFPIPGVNGGVGVGMVFELDPLPAR